jgi:Ni,Fe-hydrogenase I large subunit
VHFKLRQKDQIIEEFKREAQAYYAEKQSEGAMTARTSKFAQLIEKDQSQDQSSRQ